MKILRESYQDIESYLRGSELLESIFSKYGKNFAVELTSGEVCNYVRDLVNQMFDTDQIKVEEVSICKATGNQFDLIESTHEVINYNGSYYDYCALAFNDSFNGLIKIANLPIVQKVVHSDKQITDRLSTVKGYVILGY